ncbi:MAG: hypothetical protein Rubg2KO_30210 [Rubricoccaceae bacterium]
MGHRANLIIIEKGEVSVYYDHWAANILDVELFWGPKLAREFASQRDPLSPSTEWLDETWCEGGAVLDFDTQSLLWFGGEDVLFDVPTRRVHFEMMSTQWPGWALKWAGGHVVELGDYVGYPRGALLTGTGIDPRKVSPTSSFDGFATLISVVQSGQLSLTGAGGGFGALQLGTPQVQQILNLPLSERLGWNGDLPKAGLHLDLDSKRLLAWLAHPECCVHERVAPAWEGFEVEYVGDQFERHLEVLGTSLSMPLRSKNALWAERLDFIERHSMWEARNPVRDLPTSINVTEINPATDQVRGSVGTLTQKKRILEEVRKRQPLG